MMVLDVEVCLLNWWGTILLVFTVGGLLYSTPAMPGRWMLQVNRWRDWTRRSSDSKWAAYWLGGRNSEPKHLQARRTQLEEGSR